MSVKIEITRPEGATEATFAPVTVEQSDLVFWHNSDAEAHFPVPGCSKLGTDQSGSLKVEPDGTSAPFQPAPQHGFPQTIPYGCALHDGESGTLTVNVDPNVAPVPPIAPLATPITIEIGPGGVFGEADAPAFAQVVWHNGDAQTHFPVPDCTGLSTEGGGVSNGLQPAPQPTTRNLVYGCAIPGHENERGQINVYQNILPVGAAPAISSGTPAAAAVATGGKSPYVPGSTGSPYLALQETAPAGSSLGLAVICIAPPPATGPITFQLNATDALGQSINQPYTVTVTVP